VSELKRSSIKSKFAPKIKFHLTGESYPEDRLSAHIEISGRNTVIIEGCRAVAEYDCESITFSGKNHVRVKGSRLELRGLDGGIATVKGSITAVEFV